MTTVNRNGSMATSRVKMDDDLHAPRVISLDASNMSSAEIEQIKERFYRQLTAIAAQEEKTRRAVALIRRLFEHGHVTLRQAFEFLEALDGQSQFAPPRQQKYERWQDRFLDLQIARIEQLMELGANNIAEEVARVLDRYFPSRRKGGYYGIKAGIALGARIGLETPGEVGEVVDVEVHTPSQPFDGFVVGSMGKQDEFGDLDTGSP